MKFSTIVIGLLLVGFCMAGGFSFFLDQQVKNTYGVQINQSYSDPFNSTLVLSEKIANNTAFISNRTVNTGSGIFIITLIPDMLILLRDLVTLPFTVLLGIMTFSFNTLGITNPIVSTFFTAIIGAFAMFAFISAVLRWNS